MTVRVTGSSMACKRPGSRLCCSNLATSLRRPVGHCRRRGTDPSSHEIPPSPGPARELAGQAGRTSREEDLARLKRVISGGSDGGPAGSPSSGRSGRPGVGNVAVPGGAISRQCSDRPGQGRAFFLEASFVAQNRHLITLPSSSRAQVRVRRLIPRGHGDEARTPGAGSAGIGSRWPRHRPLVRRRHSTPPPRRTMCR
jgi:hypothetical protein